MPNYTADMDAEVIGKALTDITGEKDATLSSRRCAARFGLSAELNWSWWVARRLNFAGAGGKFRSDALSPGRRAVRRRARDEAGGFAGRAGFGFGLPGEEFGSAGMREEICGRDPGRWDCGEL